MRIVLRRHQKAFMARIDTVAIEAAIRNAERTTTGEIRVAVLPHIRGGLAKAVEPAAKKFGMTGTKDRNGVLILVDPSRRTFLVWGDTAIHARVEPGFWTEVAAAIEERFRSDDFTGGLVRGIETAGRALATHFPAGPGGHTNTKPDGVVLS